MGCGICGPGGSYMEISYYDFSLNIETTSPVSWRLQKSTLAFQDNDRSSQRAFRPAGATGRLCWEWIWICSLSRPKPALSELTSLFHGRPMALPALFDISRASQVALSNDLSDPGRKFDERTDRWMDGRTEIHSVSSPVFSFDPPPSHSSLCPYPLKETLRPSFGWTRISSQVSTHIAKWNKVNQGYKAVSYIDTALVTS